MRKTCWIVLLMLAAIPEIVAAPQTAFTIVQAEPVQAITQPEQVPVQPFVIARGGAAFEVLQDFRGVLNQYPPTLRDILRRDPALMLDPNFLEPYPALAAYLEEHPEVVHNPTYFLGSLGGNNISENVAISLVFLTIAGAIIWLVRTGVEYRRWSRASKVQAEVQSKLLDRFSNSQELLAYLETPAGRRFLDSAPAFSEAGGPPPGAATNRILWSIQAGLVLALGGWGLHFAIPRIADPGAADPLYVIGTLAIALGIGFVLSAGVALVLSHNLGLIKPSKDKSEPVRPGES